MVYQVPIVLTNVTIMDDTMDTSGYRGGSYSWSSMVRLINNSTTMNFSILMSNIVDACDNQSTSSVLKRRSPSIKSNHTYCGSFGLMKDCEEDTNMSYCTMDVYSVTESENMFVPYETTTFDEEDSLKMNRIESLCLVGRNHRYTVLYWL